MYEEHPAFIAPDENAKIWRYMDFSRLISILEMNCLYFARADRFEDQFEGSLPFLSSKINRAYNLTEILKANPRSKRFYQPDRVYQTRTTIGLNCWHINEYESAAMWKLYLSSSDGFAIQSTFGKLRDSLQGCDERVFIGKVNYIDYEQGTIPLLDTFSPFLTKRISFQHERELRAVIWDHTTVNSETIEPIPDSRLNVPVDVSVLIDNVYLAPDSPAWLAELVKAILRRYSLNIPVTNSQMSETPLF